MMNNSTYCGIDVGGANTKYVVLSCVSNKEFNTLELKSHYFPFWERKAEFPEFIKDLIQNIEDKYPGTEFGCTITAELSDSFETKRDGIKFIVHSITKACANIPQFYSTSGQFFTPDDAVDLWIKTAASNWHATARIVGRFSPDTLLVDIGSTTTDLIRIFQSKPCPVGLTDTKRLQTGELVYVGALRTNVAALATELLIDGIPTQTSSEFFACMGDVLRVLGMIKSQEYSIPTPDGRSNSIDYCMARIARVVCSDVNLLSPDQIVNLAKQLFQRASERIKMAVERQIGSGLPWPPKEIVLTGVGAKIFDQEVIQKVDSRLVYLSDILGVKEAENAPAFSIAVLLEEWMKRENH